MKSKNFIYVIAVLLLSALFLIPSQGQALEEWNIDDRSLRLYIFNTGFGNIPYSHMVKGDRRDKVKVPILAFVIEHPKGMVVVDTGFNRLLVEDPKAYAGRITYHLFLKTRVIMEPDQDLPSQMEATGLDPLKAKYVILTHPHFDHTGEVLSFPNANVLISADDLNSLKKDWDLWHGYRREDVLDHPNIEVVTYQDDTVYEMFPNGLDLFDDGTIVIVPTPGHTPGSQSVIINLNGKLVFLAGDAVYISENFRRPAAKGRILMRSADDNKKKAWESILAIREFWLAYPDSLIIPSHDYLLFTVLPRAPSYYY